MKYTFVTVAHREDLGLLRLQARSMRLYLPPELVAEIIVVANPRAEPPMDWSVKLLAEYGRLASVVRILEASAIGEIPQGTDGWFSQQILKLMAAQMVKTERYVVLDAKNHLVFPLLADFLEYGNKIRSLVVFYERHPLMPYLLRTLQYFGLDDKERMEPFLPTSTPFTFPTQVVRDLVQYVTEREQKPFPIAFLSLQVTEFFLFTGFLISHRGEIEDFYDLSGRQGPVIWEETATQNPGQIVALIAWSENQAVPFFTIHRLAFRRLTDSSREKIAGFWQRRGLFKSVSDAYSFLSLRQILDDEVTIHP